jgi:hypothetical protein
MIEILGGGFGIASKTLQGWKFHFTHIRWQPARDRSTLHSIAAESH